MALWQPEDRPPDWVPNLSWITDGLAIGGRFPSERTEDMAIRHRVRAVIDLREEDRDDEEILVRHGISFLHLPVPDLCAASLAQLDDGVGFAIRHLDRGERVLVHCEHGIGRSATLALCILVAGGDPPLDALERAKSGRALVSPSPAQYECWAAWLRAHAARGPVAWTVPDFEAFAGIAYRHLANRR